MSVWGLVGVAISKASCMAAASSANDEVNAAQRVVGLTGLPQVTVTLAPPSLVPTVVVSVDC